MTEESNTNFDASGSDLLVTVASIWSALHMDKALMLTDGYEGPLGELLTWLAWAVIGWGVFGLAALALIVVVLIALGAMALSSFVSGGASV